MGIALNVISGIAGRTLISSFTAGVAGILLTLSPLSQAQNQGFGTVTPGGVQPDLERRKAPEETEKPDYDIPPVPERPLMRDQGPRIQVKRFRLEGIEDIPETDIDHVKVAALVEKIRSNNPDGFTIGELQTVADQVTRYYRQQGLILALAIVPEQDIEDGVVTISVLSGELGQLSAANNKRYSEDVLLRPLRDLEGKPVQVGQIESALLRVNDLPGLEVAGIFRPGENVGETELVLNTRQEKAFDFAAYADNYGVETTGRQRLIGSVGWNNPLGIGDRLEVSALQTFDPEDSTYGQFKYEAPFFSPEYLFGIAHSRNDYAIAQSQAQGIAATDGDTRISSLYWHYLHTRGRRLNITGVLDLSTKQAEVELEDFNLVLGEDQLTVLTAGVEVDSVDSIWGGGINEFSAYYHRGIPDFLGSMERDSDPDALRRDDNGEPIGGDFQKLSFKARRLQLIDDSNLLLLRFRGQYTEDLLSSIEQFPMGGPRSVRAYPVSEYIRDNGFFTSAEWIINAPGFSNKPAFNGRTWGEVLSVSLFVDYAYGHSDEGLVASQDRDQDIGGVGIGLEFTPAEQLFFKLEAATPTSGEEPSNDDDPQFWVSAGWDF